MGRVAEVGHSCEGDDIGLKSLLQIKKSYEQSILFVSREQGGI